MSWYPFKHYPKIRVKEFCMTSKISLDMNKYKLHVFTSKTCMEMMQCKQMWIVSTYLFLIFIVSLLSKHTCEKSIFKVWSILLQFTASDYPFGIFKLFLAKSFITAPWGCTMRSPWQFQMKDFYDFTQVFFPFCTLLTHTNC